MTKTRTNTKDPFAARLRHSTSALMRENVSVSEYMTENSSNHMAFVCMIEDLNIINSIKNRENNKYDPLSLTYMDDLEDHPPENTTTPVGMPSRHIITCTTITIADMTTTTSNNNHLMWQTFYFLPSLHKCVLHELVHFNTNYSTPIELRSHHDFGHQSLHTNPDLILMQCPVLMTCLVGAKISFDAQSLLFDCGNSHPQQRRNGIRMPLLLLLIPTAAKGQFIEIDSVFSAISQFLTYDDEWYAGRVEVGERRDKIVDIAPTLDEGEINSTFIAQEDGECIDLFEVHGSIARNVIASDTITGVSAPTQDVTLKLLFVVSVEPLVISPYKLRTTALTRHYQTAVLLFKTEQIDVHCDWEFQDVHLGVVLPHVAEVVYDCVQRCISGTAFGTDDSRALVRLTASPASTRAASYPRIKSTACSIGIYRVSKTYPELVLRDVYSGGNSEAVKEYFKSLPHDPSDEAIRGGAVKSLSSLDDDFDGHNVDQFIVDITPSTTTEFVDDDVTMTMTANVPFIIAAPTSLFEPVGPVEGIGEGGFDTTENDLLHSTDDALCHPLPADPVYILVQLNSNTPGSHIHAIFGECLPSYYGELYTIKTSNRYLEIRRHQWLLIIGVDTLRPILTPRRAQQHRILDTLLTNLLLRSEFDATVWGGVWRKDDIWDQVYYDHIIITSPATDDDCVHIDCSIAKNVNIYFDKNIPDTTSTSSWMTHDWNVPSMWGVINVFLVLVFAMMVVTVTTTADVSSNRKPPLFSNYVLMNFNIGPLALGDVFSVVNGIIIITDVHTFCHDVSTSTDATPVDVIDDIHKLLGTSIVNYVGESSGLVSRMGVITGWIAAGNVIINAMTKRMLLWGEIWYDCFNSEMFDYSIVGITRHHWLLISTWLPPVRLSGFVLMDFVDEHDRLTPSVNAVFGWKERPMVAGGEREESTVKMILLWGEQYGCLANDKEVIGISALYGFQSYGEIELCIGVQNTVYSWGAAYVVIPQTDTVMTTDLQVSDVPVGLQPSVDDTITCVHMPRSQVSRHHCSELSDSNHRLRVLTSMMWSPISTSSTLHDIPTGNGTSCAKPIDIDVSARATTFLALGLEDKCRIFRIQRSIEPTAVIESSYDDDNSDGLVIPCFKVYSNSVASYRKKRLRLMGCNNGRTEHTSQQYDMIGLVDHSAQLKDGLYQQSSWGARYNRYPNYESDYDILAGVDGFDDRVVDNDFFCSYDDDGSMFDMDEDSIDTGADSNTGVGMMCITTDTPADGHVTIDENSYLQVTISDTRFAADRAFTDTMVCRCADLLCEETLSSRYTPLDVEIYAVRTTLEKTMIKSTSHCLEVLFHGQSTSSGYDDPNTTEYITFARRRPMFVTSVVDDKLRDDMVNSKSYVVITHDSLRKHHRMLIHRCITGYAISSTGQRELIAISVGYNYGDVLSKIWTYYRDVWILLLGELVWKRDMMDLALLRVGFEYGTVQRIIGE